MLSQVQTRDGLYCKRPLSGDLRKYKVPESLVRMLRQFSNRIPTYFTEDEYDDDFGWNNAFGYGYYTLTSALLYLAWRSLVFDFAFITNYDVPILKKSYLQFAYVDHTIPCATVLKFMHHHQLPCPYLDGQLPMFYMRHLPVLQCVNSYIHKFQNYACSINLKDCILFRLSAVKVTTLLPTLPARNTLNFTVSAALYYVISFIKIKPFSLLLPLTTLHFLFWLQDLLIFTGFLLLCPLCLFLRILTIQTIGKTTLNFPFFSAFLFHATYLYELHYWQEQCHLCLKSHALALLQHVAVIAVVNSTSHTTCKEHVWICWLCWLG